MLVLGCFTGGTNMTKECVICGDEFEAIRKVRQYCDKCQKNTAKARYREERAIQDSKYRMGELPSQQIKEMVCKYCGQTYHTYAGRSYCSDRCREAYRRHAADSGRLFLFNKQMAFPAGKLRGARSGHICSPCKTAQYQHCCKAQCPKWYDYSSSH